MGSTLAHRLDPVLVLVSFDEIDHDRGRRSSSACAKKADALRRTSLARRNALTSRSNSLDALALRRGQPWPCSAVTLRLA